MKRATLVIIATILLSISTACGLGAETEESSVFTRTFTAEDLPLFVIQPNEVSIPLQESTSSLDEISILQPGPTGDPTKIWEYNPQAGELRYYSDSDQGLYFTSYAILFNDSSDAHQAFKILDKYLQGWSDDYKCIPSVGLGDESSEFALPQQPETNWTYYHYLWRTNNVVLLITSQDASGQSRLQEADVFGLADQIQSRMK